MEPRIAYTKYSLNALHAMYALEKHLKSSTIEEKLLHLIKLRASQINGCAYCIDNAFPRRPRPRRHRATPLCSERLARDPFLHPARTCRPRVDRSRHPRLPDTCT